METDDEATRRTIRSNRFYVVLQRLFGWCLRRWWWVISGAGWFRAGQTVKLDAVYWRLLHSLSIGMGLWHVLGPVTAFLVFDLLLNVVYYSQWALYLVWDIYIQCWLCPFQWKITCSVSCTPYLLYGALHQFIDQQIPPRKPIVLVQKALIRVEAHPSVIRGKHAVIHTFNYGGTTLYTMNASTRITTYRHKHR